MGQVRADRIWQVSSALLALSLLLNVFPGVEVKRLRIEAVRNRQADPRIGSILRELPVKDLNGNGLRLQFGAIPSLAVIYAFSPRCSFCAQDCKNILALSDQFRIIRFIGLSTSESRLTEYLRNPLFLLISCLSGAQPDTDS
ncbi:MAG: hypothetical protein WHT08_12700 [Bryobacteraceae bacterium]